MKYNIWDDFFLEEAIFYCFVIFITSFLFLRIYGLGRMFFISFVLTNLVFYPLLIILCWEKYDNRRQNFHNFIDKIVQEEGEVDSEFNNINKFYINLDRSTERRDNMESQIKRLKIKNIERVPGIYGKDLKDIENINIFGETLKNEFKTIGLHSKLGCFLSHIKALKRAKELDIEIALILEDDFIFDFSKKWKKPLKTIIDEAPSDWEIINLSNFFRGTVRSKDFYISYDDREFASTMFYLINKKGINRIIERFSTITYKNKKKHRPVSDMFLYQNTNSYSVRNPLVPSDICHGDSNIDDFELDWRCSRNMKNMKNLFVEF